MADILVSVDGSTLVPKLGVSESERLNWMKSFQIYDINSNGSKSGPYGPTALPVPASAANLALNTSGSRDRKAIQSNTDASGNQVLDALGMGAVSMSGFRKRSNPTTRAVVVALGDSLPEAQVASYPFSEGDGGWWLTGTPSPADTTFLVKLHFSPNCAGTDTATLDWDGSSRLRVNIAGDSSTGPWVTIGDPVTGKGGGFFALYSGANGKFLMPSIRWRNRPAAATTYTVTNSNNTYPPGRFGLSGVFSGALMRAGLLSQKVMNFALGGDRAIDCLNRIDQVKAVGPDVVLLSVGVNWIAEAATVVPQIIDSLVYSGIPVIVATTPPRAWATAGDVALHDAAVAAIKAKAGPNVTVLDVDRPLRNPANATGSIEVASIYNDDEIHLAYNATLGRIADLAEPVLRQMFPWAQKTRRVTSGNVYSATTNQTGNLVGSRALMTGTGGTKGTTPTPSGELPDNWADVTVGGAFTSIALTAPGSASPIAREDIPGEYWTQGVYSTASGFSTRYLQVPCEFAPTVGGKYRVRVPFQLLNVTKLTEFEVDVVMTGATIPTRFRTCQMGTLPNTTTNTLDDSGILYFESDDFVIPASTTAAIVRFVVGCATGGSVTLRAGRPDVFRVFS